MKMKTSIIMKTSMLTLISLTVLFTSSCKDDETKPTTPPESTIDVAGEPNQIIIQNEGLANILSWLSSPPIRTTS